MRLVDPNLLTSETGKILVRDNAIVFSIEHARLIITADQVRPCLRAPRLPLVKRHSVSAAGYAAYSAASLSTLVFQLPRPCA